MRETTVLGCGRENNLEMRMMNKQDGAQLWVTRCRVPRLVSGLLEGSSFKSEDRVEWLEWDTVWLRCDGEQTLSPFPSSSVTEHTDCDGRVRSAHQLQGNLST